MRTITVLILVVLATSSVFSQERTTVPERVGTPPPSANPAFFLQHSSKIFLPGFRDYDRILQGQVESIALGNRLQLMQLTEEIRRDASDRHIRDLLLARFNLSLQFGEMQGESSMWQYFAQLLLGEATQFAYTYARERVRKQSITEFDYLYLPAGPGVIRTFGEARDSALEKGALQTWSVWQDVYYEYRNKPCVPVATPNP